MTILLYKDEHSQSFRRHQDYTIRHLTVLGKINGEVRFSIVFLRTSCGSRLSGYHRQDSCSLQHREKLLCSVHSKLNCERDGILSSHTDVNLFWPKGESGLGKSTLINSLFLTDLYPERIIPGAAGKTVAHNPRMCPLHWMLITPFLMEQKRLSERFRSRRPRWKLRSEEWNFVSLWWTHQDTETPSIARTGNTSFIQWTAILDLID